MRHFLSSFAVAAALAAAPAPLLAQNPFEPVMYINNAAITRYEVDQRLRFMQVLGAPAPPPPKRKRLWSTTVCAPSPPASLGSCPPTRGCRTGSRNSRAARACRRPNSPPRWNAPGRAAGLPRFRQRGPCVALGGPRTRGSPDQGVRRRGRSGTAQTGRNADSVAGAGVRTHHPRPPGQEQQALNLARQIAGANLSSNAFEDAARQYSAAESAQSGGRLAWVNIDNLPPALRGIISALQPGQTTQPLTVDGAVVLFHLRDSQGTLRPGAMEQVIDYATLRLANASEAATLAARTRSCDDLYVQAGPQAATQVQRQTLSQGAIPALIGQRLASMDRDEAGVVDYGNGADLVMLCSRQPALVAQMDNDVATTALPDDGVEAAVPGAGPLPTREAVRDQIFNRKANAAADAYLAELRADAIIRRP